jgi:thymidylate synthase
MNYYQRYYRTLLREGIAGKPRGLNVKQKHNVAYYSNPMEVFTRENFNPAIGLMEGLQFIAGVFDAAAIKRIAPNIDISLFTEQSAYGPIAKDQVDWVIDELLHDPDSRRAVISLTNPKQPLKDRPCTIALQFQMVVKPSIRNLQMTAYMRSSDVLWGLQYDILQFSLLANMIAACIFVRSNHYQHFLNTFPIFIGNSHVYTDRELSMLNSQRELYNIEWPLHTVAAWRKKALSIINDKTLTASKLKEMFLWRD